MMGLESKDAVVQNLKDAGCSSEIVKEFLYYFDEDQKDKQLDVLEKHRKQLLDSVHREEKKICCLDYLVYQIKKGKENKNEQECFSYFNQLTKGK